MSQVNIEGRIESLPVEVQEVLRDIVTELNDLRRRVQRGAGTPQSRIKGYRGDIWQRTDGSASQAVYVFEGPTDGTVAGWVAK